MDTVRWIVGAALIAIGIPIFALARYFEATEDQKKHRIRDLKALAIIWMAVGVLLYVVNLFTRG